MHTDDRDDLVGDVADALTLDQKVQWERCARLAEGADREKIENLRIIERVLASRPRAGIHDHDEKTGYYLDAPGCTDRGRPGLRHLRHSKSRRLAYLVRSTADHARQSTGNDRQPA